MEVVLDRRTRNRILARLKRDAERIARHFDLTYQAIEAERSNVKSRFGICYADGLIKIRLRHAVTARPLKYSSLVDTLCHELAHLRHFNHGQQFQRFYRELLAYARAQGIYRPGRSRSVGGKSEPRSETPRAKPVQLSLF
ncbi:DUF45 domain-containing protein [Myxococcota bacterium]|nr:DUF45 domain-containing protein [Myxococcota bacterium]